ncbi:hypothetical protein NPIL_623821 [Nephila pilipes]|uniref:Uncharacterized protein n=1 Tax=Nephila pilipes TaxID=299642 RepID=A0A8X6PLG8_NEPPI|nr:hypothetical protein NPIL_623821 [Nephila pilipes]
MLLFPSIVSNARNGHWEFIGTGFLPLQYGKDATQTFTSVLRCGCVLMLIQGQTLPRLNGREILLSSEHSLEGRLKGNLATSRVVDRASFRKETSFNSSKRRMQ